MTALELAQRLVGSGKPITPLRMGKLTRHVKTKDQLFDALLELQPEQAEAAWHMVQGYTRRLA